MARTAATKASDNEVVRAANEKKGDETELYFVEYYAVQKAKRQGLGLIKFIGESFKVQILTEQEEIESLCQLLRAVGQLLDVPKARAHMDVYFQRMRELCKSPNVSPRMPFMLQDVIELRDREWQPCNVGNAPTTLAALHETATKVKAVQETQAFHRQFSISYGGSKRSAGRNAEPAPDSWAVAGGSQPRLLNKAGDLSHFSQISNAPPMVLSPKKQCFRWQEGHQARVNNTHEPERLARGLVGTWTKLERTSEEEPDAASAAPMSEDDAKKINEDVKEFFSVCNLDEADEYFIAPTEEHRFRLVDELVSSAPESNEADSRLVTDFFSRPASQRECIRIHGDHAEGGWTTQG
ncbi:hypothetical protein EDC04DRAFT_2888042 [Pisolithus marmoratus]|nr:hypothetical protein EDC04DRAFT_2888042 [Pisolithus marmoratus]